MSVTLIQCDYETLERTGQRFVEHAERTDALMQRLQRGLALLRESWQGCGAEAFFAEMEGELLPAVRRLAGALEQASTTTMTIKVTFREAETEAAALFKGRELAAAPNGTPFSAVPPTPSGNEPVRPPDPADAIAEAARRGDWAAVNRLLAALPADQRAEVTFRLGNLLDAQTLKAMYADPTYGAQNIHLLTQGMVEYVRGHNTQRNRDALARVAYNTTHAGLIDERGDEGLPQGIIERARNDPVYGQQIAEYLSRYAGLPYGFGFEHRVEYRDGELIYVRTLLWTGLPTGTTGPLVPPQRIVTETPVTEALLQSLYANHSYSGLDPNMSNNPVHVDEYAFTITAPDIPPGANPEQYIYSRILAQMGEQHGAPPSHFNFPGIDGRMPQRGDALPLDLPDPGFIVVSQGFPELRIRTVTFPGVDTHPLNGSREWGVEQVGPDTYRVYTRGAARDDTIPGSVARRMGLESGFWRDLMGDAANDLTPEGVPAPPVVDWSFGATLPPPPQEGEP